MKLENNIDNLSANRPQLQLFVKLAKFVADNGHTACNDLMGRIDENSTENRIIVDRGHRMFA